MGIEELARQFKTTRITFHTDRLGLIKKTTALGWKVKSVLLQRK
jgi:hypothetical protein